MEEKTYKPSDDINNVEIDVELVNYIVDKYLPTSANYLLRVIRAMDMLGYGDYSLDLNNFISISKVNMDPDEEKLLFITLTLSHVIKLIEGIGLVVSDDIINDDYHNYLGFFSELLEAIVLVRNMTEIDAIYFSDIIANENIDEMESIFRILQYYSNDISYNVFHSLIVDFKYSFLEIITKKVNDLVTTSIEDNEDIDLDTLNNLKVITEHLTKLTNNSMFLHLILTTVDDFKYLIKNEEFISSNINNLIQKFTKEMDSNDPSVYYAFITENKDVYTMLLDIYLFNAVKFFNNDLDLETVLNYSYDSVKDLFYDREFKGISGLLKVLDNIKENVIELKNDEKFMNSFLAIVKDGKDE